MLFKAMQILRSANEKLFIKTNDQDSNLGECFLLSEGDSGVLLKERRNSGVRVHCCQERKIFKQESMKCGERWVKLEPRLKDSHLRGFNVYYMVNNLSKEQKFSRLVNKK